MSEVIKKYDERGNIVYYKDSNGKEYWSKYDGNNEEIYGKDSDGYECWFEYNEEGIKIDITEQKLKEIKFRKQEKEFLSRKFVSRFELIEL